jgi:hypothetical protein
MDTQGCNFNSLKIAIDGLSSQDIDTRKMSIIRVSLMLHSLLKNQKFKFISELESFDPNFKLHRSKIILNHNLQPVGSFIPKDLKLPKPQMESKLQPSMQDLEEIGIMNEAARKASTKKPKVIFNSAHMSLLDNLTANVYFTYTKKEI